MSAPAKHTLPALALILVLSAGVVFEVKWLYRSWVDQGWLYEWVSSWRGGPERAEPRYEARFVLEVAPTAPEAVARAGRDVRMAALHALAQDGSAEALKALIRILEDDMDADIRRQAAYALGQRGDAHAVKALLKVAMSQTAADVRKAAVHALGEIDTEAAREALRQVIETYAPLAEVRR
ncbi:MAG: HEAT repeat domain-containing protein [Rhodothermales bacterium]